MFSASFEPKDKALRPPKAEIQNYSAGAQYDYLRKKGRGRCKRENLILAKKSYTPLHYMANGGYLTTPTLFLKYRPFMIGSRGREIGGSDCSWGIIFWRKNAY